MIARIGDNLADMIGQAIRGQVTTVWYAGAIAGFFAGLALGLLISFRRDQ